ncbi:hypothetical protein [Peribacillus sp. NPDC096448]|uniref:hypothetical protein n=1 Tax=Peribacillus sp. NPDC096448 TaxID=3364395 RepID=UPI0037F3807C
MISLDPNSLVRISTDYSENMIKEIENRYIQVVSSNAIESNHFTDKPYTSLFENGRVKVMDFKLVEELLTKSIDYICKNYSEINNYILTCKFVYFSYFPIDNSLKRNKIKISKVNRYQFRQDYVAKYNNPWINNILSKHPLYFTNNDKFNALINDVETKLTKLNEDIKNIIDYGFLDSELRHEILTRTGIEVCPYCNRQYITKYQKGRKLKSTADLDHFFPKSIFQLLSLSLFNFVPSCQICNSRFKMAKSFEILYPYDKGFDNEALFEVKLNSKSTVYSITGRNSMFDLNLIVNSTGSNQIEIENSIELFNLREVYQSHKDYVKELLYKKHAYSTTYKSQLNKLFSDMKLGTSEINLFLYGNDLDPTHLGKRPLSKLAYDIINN